MYDREHFYHVLLHHLGAPTNEANLDALRAWGECEGSEAEYNPLDTTQHEDGATPYNSFESGGTTMHVWNYPDEDTGVRATVATLENGNYPHILEAFKSGHGRQIVQGNARHEMGTWGTNADCIASKFTHAQGQPQQQHQTAEVGIPNDMLANIRRATRYLQERGHRLPQSERDDVQRLEHAAAQALGVR